MKASPPAEDGEFLRRVHLDLTETIPPYEKVGPFLDDADPEKRTRLIEELLAGPAYARHMAGHWVDRLVVPDPNGPGNNGLKSPMGQWLEKAFADNRPWDQMVSTILTAEAKRGPDGRLDRKERPPTGAFYNFDGGQFATVEKTTNKVAKYFLGLQLQCAQCHDHPYAEWRQEDYWATAAFFFKMSSPDGEDLDQKAPRTRPDGFREVPPRFLDGGRPELKPKSSYRPALAQWLTAPENPYFAEAYVNRAWAHFFGRGLVNPVDDLLDTNEPTHPRLLAELAFQFRANGYDTKYLARAIVLSQTYQRSSRPAGGNDKHASLYAYAQIRSLTPRQLFNARLSLAGGGPNVNDLLRVFDTTPDLDRTLYQYGMLETLKLLNASALNEGAKLLARLVSEGRPAEQNVEALYRAVLSRRPTVQEVGPAAAHVRRKGTEGYSDLLWVLLNGAEFHLNH